MAMRLFLLLSLTLACQGVSITDRVKELHEQFPFFYNFGDERTNNADDEWITEGERNDDVDMKHYLRMLLRYWNFHGTAMQDILDSGQLPDLTHTAESFSLVNIMDKLTNDKDVREELVQAHAHDMKRREERETYADTDAYEECYKDYSSLVDPFTDRILAIVLPMPAPAPWQRWGMAMFDALCKIPEGLTDGKTHWVGAYEKCLSIHADYNYTSGRINPITEHREFDAEYCRLDFNPQVPLVGNGTNYIRLQLGICVPDTCSKENISYYIMEDNLVLGVLLKQVLRLKLDLVYCGQETDYATDSAIQAFVGILVTCVLLVVVATIYDAFFRYTIMKKFVDGLTKKGRMAIHRSISQISTVSMASDFGTPVIEAGSSESSGPSLMRQNSAPSLLRQTSSSSIGSYHPVHPDDRRRYSLKSNTDKLSSDNDNNNNGTNAARPSLTSQLSVSSQLSGKGLLPDVAELQNQVEQPSLLDRLEVGFVGFSAYSNLSRLFTANEGPENELKSLNGVRVLSWMYALYGHVWLFGPLYNESWTTGNLNRVLRELPRKWSFQPVINFHFSSDAFFVISGCLVSYYWLKKIEERGGLSVRFMCRYYFYRYWSLMPALMMVLMTYTCTYRYLGGGPLFPPNVQDADNCRTEWWTNLLFFHNIIDPDHMCLTWTWYVGILWQLYILSPLFLIPFIFKRWIGYVSLTILYIIHLGATAGVSAKLIDDEDSGIVNWFREYFLTPWCRAGPYCVGLVLGVILHTNKKIKLKIHPVLVGLGWVFALAGICAVEYGTYSIFKEGGSLWDKGTRVMYETFSTTTFGLGVAWILFACEMGYGGFITHILSWRVFIPLGRMVYPSYLIHAMMIFTFVYGQYTLLYLNTFNVLYWFFSHVWVVHLAGIFFVGLLFHWPLSSGLIRMWRVENKLDCVRAGRHPPIPEVAYDVTAAAHKHYITSSWGADFPQSLYRNIRQRLTPQAPATAVYENWNGSTAF